MEKHIYYRGTDKGIDYEIWNHPTELTEFWAGYLIFKSGQFNFEELIKTGYLSNSIYSEEVAEHPIMDAVDDNCHGGVTFVEKTTTGRGTTTLKVGWDYQHSSSGYTDVDRVMGDIKRCVNAVWEAYPNLKLWCITTGGYYFKSDGWFYTDSQGRNMFISSKGIEWRKKRGWSNPLTD